MRTAICFLSVLFCTALSVPAALAGGYEILYDTRSGSGWYGGDDRAGISPRDIGGGQSVLVEADIVLNSFSFFFATRFDFAENPDNAGHEVTLTLNVRNQSGTTLRTVDLTLPNTYSGGWATWTGIDLAVDAGTTLIFTSYLNGAYDTLQVYNSHASDTASGYANGTRYTKSGTGDADMEQWSGWNPHSWDAMFWLQGTTVGPDLEIVSFTAPATAEPEAGIGGQIMLRVRNAGSTDITTPVSAGFYVSSDATITTSDQLLLGGRESIASLVAGAEVDVPLFTGARIPASWPLGDAFLGVVLDESNLVAESNETNNTASSAVLVSAPQPDLEIVSFSAPNNAVPGTAIGGQILLRIRNRGTQDITESIGVGFYVSTDDVITTADQLLVGGREGAGTLAAGAEVDVELFAGASIPADFPLEPAFLGVIVDEFDNIDESDEGNNTAVSAVNVVAVPVPSESWGTLKSMYGSGRTQ